MITEAGQKNTWYCFGRFFFSCALKSSYSSKNAKISYFSPNLEYIAKIRFNQETKKRSPANCGKEAFGALYLYIWAHISSHWILGKRQKAVYRLVTAPQGGTQKCTLATTLHADWSNRPRTAFRRWTVHQVAAIQVGRHRFSGVPLPLPGGKKASEGRSFLGLFPRQNCLRILRPWHFGTTRYKSYRPLPHTQPWQPTSLSKITTHTARGNSLSDELET